MRKDFYDLLVKRFPLTLIQNDENYIRACSLQAELIAARHALDPFGEVYLKVITVFITAYESGLRLGEEE